jgi:hypothetical protein
MKSQFRTSGTTTLRPVRKASPLVVRVVGRTPQRLADLLNPRWPRSLSPLLADKINDDVTSCYVRSADFVNCPHPATTSEFKQFEFLTLQGP